DIPDAGSASPYPSPIEVAGLPGTIRKVTVELAGFVHTFPDDVDVLLVAPNGANAILMSDVGGDRDADHVGLTLSDNAANPPLPDDGPLLSGLYRPTNVGTGDSFPAPAPAPSGGSALAVFNGLNPNGTWKLFVVDDNGMDSGSIAFGWALDFQVGDFPTTTAVSGAPSPAFVGQALTL